MHRWIELICDVRWSFRKKRNVEKAQSEVSRRQVGGDRRPEKEYCILAKSKRLTVSLEAGAKRNE